MSKMTLLEIVQDIANDLESDDVNSINDSTEALEIAQVVKTTFFNITDGKDYPHFEELFQLTALGNTAKPNFMQIPETIETVKWIKYNTKTVTDTKNKFTEIKYKTPADFLTLLDARDSTESNILTVSYSTGHPIPLNIVNDKAPQFYTSFDEDYIIFDSYDAAVDTTMLQSKTSCMGRRSPTFTISDTFTPDLPTQMFSYLLNEAKATAFIVLKQSTNSKAEQHSISQRRRMSQDAWKLKNGVTLPNYGRK